MGLTGNTGIKNYYKYFLEKDILKANSSNKWRNPLTKEDYNTLVTIQRPMKNKYNMEGDMENFFNLNRVDSLFYSVERNTNAKQELSTGYHIHLMFNAYQCNREHLAFALDTSYDSITYYEEIDNNLKVASYVTKYMKGDQTHYNFYKK